MPGKHVLKFNEIDKDDANEVGIYGVKFANLAKEGMPIPEGFIVTSHSFHDFFKENNLERKIKHLVNTINFNDPNSIRQVSKIIKTEFENGSPPNDFATQVYSSYKNIGGLLKDSKVLVKSSPTKQTHTRENSRDFNGILGETSLIEKIKELWSINFDEINLISKYTHKFHIPEQITALLIQREVKPEISGKILTTDLSDKNKMIIKAINGFFHNNLNLKSMPDHYEIHKKDHEIVLKNAYDADKKSKQKITDVQILELGRLGKLLEKMHYFPQEIDFRIEKNKIYLSGVKPLTT